MVLELMGRKVRMGNIFRDDGARVPVTFVELIPLTVTRVKREDGPDGYSAIQVGWDPVPGHKLTRAEVGHQKNKEGMPFRRLAEMRVDDPSGYKLNQRIGFDMVGIGDRIDVVGTSKGRGFAGGMKRHHFHGQSGSHGTSKVHRKPMSSGATDAARVFRGTRKPGHMGASGVTVRNLEVVMLDEKSGIMAIKGAVPGPSGGLLRIIPRKRRVKG
jgi:large subunit ribosomal protein L3